jgi:uncharacterized damage-inducible protein DinB
MKSEVDRQIALLTPFPATLDAWLRPLPDSLIHANEGEGTWSAFDVVAHLIDAEVQDWIPRTKWILEHANSQPFPPFDRGGHTRVSAGKTLPQLLDEFRQTRSASLAELRDLNLQPEDLERRGRHPALGEVTLSQLLSTWVVHDVSHTHQIARVLAHQHLHAVGPWRKFLGVLQCNGHSEQA